jgi:hypothetical protein
VWGLGVTGIPQQHGLLLRRAWHAQGVQHSQCDALSTPPTSQTANTFPYPGTTPSVSTNLGSNAIVWAIENNNPAVLHADDATNLSNELYNSNQAGSRDLFGPGNKFITPVVANGKVFVGTPTGIAEFGLLP